MLKEIIITFLKRFASFFTAPYTHPEMIWIAIPLFAVIILMTFYFSKYKDEELGWNTALGNSLILIFISIDLLKHIFNKTIPANAHNYITYGGLTVLTALLMLKGIFLLNFNFKHFLPKRIAYIISSPLSVNLTAFTIIIIVYTSMPINITTIISAIIYFTILMLVFVNLKKLFKRMWLRIEKIKYEELNEDINKESEDIEDKKKLIREQKKKIKETEEEIQKEEGTKPKKEQNKKK